LHFLGLAFFYIRVVFGIGLLITLMKAALIFSEEKTQGKNYGVCAI